MYKLSQTVGTMFKPYSQKKTENPVGKNGVLIDSLPQNSLSSDIQPFPASTLEVYVQRTGQEGSGHVSATLRDSSGAVVNHLSLAPTNFIGETLAVMGLGLLPVCGQNWSDYNKDHLAADERHTLTLSPAQFEVATQSMLRLQEQISTDKIVYAIAASFGSYGKVVPDFLCKGAVVLAAALDSKRQRVTYGNASNGSSQKSSKPKVFRPIITHNCVSVVGELLEESVGITDVSTSFLPHNVGEILRAHGESGRIRVASVELQGSPDNECSNIAFPGAIRP